jgi:serine/threonine protein phosphatase PrpC
VKSHARVMVSGDTDVGVKRNHNEDNFAIMEEDNLFIVADGMGGHACGEIASQLAIDTLRDFFRSTSADPEATWPYKMDRTRGYEENRLVTGIKLANLRIYESQQRDTKLRGMGTTVAAISVVDSGVYIGHVGDSRVYRLRDGKLQQLTEDHSLLNDYIKMRRLSDEEIKNFPHKNVIVRALGMKESVRVDAIYDQPRPGDVYILCTDGLCGPVTDAEIQELALSHTDLKKLTQALIHRANEHGGPDNITVVAARWVGAG